MLKKSLFSSVRPRQLLHPPTLSLPRQPLCPGTHLFPCGVLAALRGLGDWLRLGRCLSRCPTETATDRKGGSPLSLAAALLAERRVLARRGWEGEKYGLFEHPAWCTPVIPDVQISEIGACHRVFPQPARPVTPTHSRLLRRSPCAIIRPFYIP